MTNIKTTLAELEGELLPRLRLMADQSDFGRRPDPHHIYRRFITHTDTLLTALREQEEALERARGLVAKLEECGPAISDAFMHRQMRCGPYDGPNYGEELAALQAALNHKANPDAANGEAAE